VDAVTVSPHILNETGVRESTRSVHTTAERPAFIDKTWEFIFRSRKYFYLSFLVLFVQGPPLQRTADLRGIRMKTFRGLIPFHEKTPEFHQVRRG
jgi:hypothetical protein